MNETIIISILTLLLGGGTVGALITFWANREKTDAETDNLVIEGATALLKPLTERVTCLEGDLATERKRRKELNDELEKAKRDNEENNERNIKRIVALEDSLLAKDKEIASLQFEAAELKEKVRLLEEQLEKIGKTPVTKEKTEPLPRPKSEA
jgi:predicted RNase H-like nuclease (RuvC/YqgF family)